MKFKVSGRLLICASLLFFSCCKREAIKPQYALNTPNAQTFQDSVISVILNHSTEAIKADLNISQSKISYFRGKPMMVTIPSKRNPKTILFSAVANGGITSRWVEGFGATKRASNQLTIWSLNKESYLEKYFTNGKLSLVKKHSTNGQIESIIISPNVLISDNSERKNSNKLQLDESVCS